MGVGAPSPRRVRLASVEGTLPRYLGSGAEPGAANAFWKHLGVYGTHFLIAITPFSTRRVRLASAKGALPSCWGSGADSQPSTLLGAFGCEWNPFLNTINTIFNSACQTGKRRWRSPLLFGGLHLGVNGTHFELR